MRIFIIGGKSGSGKTNLAKMIKDYYDKENKKSVITEYSKYLKLFAKEMVNWNFSEPKPRKFLQDIGIFIRKNIDPDFLINRMQEDLLVYEKYYDNVIISDARFIDELEVIKSKYPDTYTIHLINTNDNNLKDSEKNHISEISLDDYLEADYTIEISSLEELESEIETILEEIK